jgi:hypothetical protein
VETRTQASKATPFFERLCLAMTKEEVDAGCYWSACCALTRRPQPFKFFENCPALLAMFVSATPVLGGMRNHMHRHQSTPSLLGRHSLTRYVLVRGLVVAGAAVLVVSYRAGALEVRPLLAAAGLSTSVGSLVQSRDADSVLSGPAAASGDCRPFACASPPRAKRVSAPAANPGASEQDFRAPEPLVVRSALTGEPYATPDKPPVIVHSGNAHRGPGLAALARPGGRQ